MRGTKGTETSKYLQEKKENSTSLVVASEKERLLPKPYSCKPVGVFYVG